MDLKIGDSVKLVQPGSTYSSYETFFNENNISCEKWKNGLESYTFKGRRFKIIDVGKHRTNRSPLYVISNLSNAFIVNKRAIEFINNGKNTYKKYK